MPNRVSHNHVINVGTGYVGLRTESSSTHILTILSGTSYQLMKHEPIKLLCMNWKQSSRSALRVHFLSKSTQPLSEERQEVERVKHNKLVAVKLDPGSHRIQGVTLQGCHRFCPAGSQSYSPTSARSQNTGDQSSRFVTVGFVSQRQELRCDSHRVRGFSTADCREQLYEWLLIPACMNYYSLLPKVICAICIISTSTNTLHHSQYSDISTS